MAPINIHPFAVAGSAFVVSEGTTKNDALWVIIAWGSHPFPKLSPTAPMVLRAQVCGRDRKSPDYNKALPSIRPSSGFAFVTARLIGSAQAVSPLPQADQSD
jgi:hypothetical protein